jgi:FkbM family methyltransferase
MDLARLKDFPFTSVLDIGANVGNWTREAMKLWPGAEFHMIEANEGCRLHLEAVGCSYDIALLGAIAQSGVAFYDREDNSEVGSVHRDTTGIHDSAAVSRLNQHTLSERLGPYRKFDLIKIGTQGSELDIMRGGEEIIRKARCVIVEVSDKPYYEGAPLAPEVREYMNDIGFGFCAEVGRNPAIDQYDLAFFKTEADAAKVSPAKVSPAKLDVMIVLYCYAGNGGVATVLPEIATWLAKTVKRVDKDPRVGRVGVVKAGDIPLTMVRNSMVRKAVDGGFDAILMIDSDNVPDLYLGHDPDAKSFWQTSFDFLYERHQRNLPTVVCAPYCGPPPHPVNGGAENVYVFHFADTESDAGGLQGFSIEAYSRDHAAMIRGIQPIAAGPTGCILYSTDAFAVMPVHNKTDEEILQEVAKGEIGTERAKALLRMQSYFWYEYTDGYQTKKASTEDVTNTREINLAGIQKYGEPIVFCNWDAWAGHVKPKVVGKPKPVVVEQVSELLAEAIRKDRHAGEEIREVDFTADGVEESEPPGPPEPPPPETSLEEESYELAAEKPVANKRILGAMFTGPTTSPEDCQSLRDAMEAFKAERIVVIGDKTGEVCWAINKPVFAIGLNAANVRSDKARDLLRPMREQDPLKAARDMEPQEVDAVVVKASVPAYPDCAKEWFEKHLKPGGHIVVVGDDALDSDAWRHIEGTSLAFAKKP